MWLRNRLSLSREQQRAPDCCWPTFRLLSAPPSRTEFCRKTCSSRRGRATFKSPCPELVLPEVLPAFSIQRILNKRNPLFSSVQLLSHVRLCDPMECSTPGLPVHHELPEPVQTHRVGDARQPSHPLSPPSPPALSLSQHQGLVQ